MFVVMADQDRSRVIGDRVEELLTDLDARGLAGAGVFPFDRTVGDEVQALYPDGAEGEVLTVVLHLLRLRDWAVGIGVGAVTDLRETSRASSGPAYVAAREAVERAKGRPVPVAVGHDGPATDGTETVRADAEALLTLQGGVVRRRTEAGWAAVDALATAQTRREVAERLGVTPAAVSQRLQVALWDEEVATHPLARRLLAALNA